MGVHNQGSMNIRVPQAALHFQSTYIDLGDQMSINPTGAISVSAWIKPDTLYLSQVVSRHNDSTNAGGTLRTNSDGDINFLIRTGGVYRNVASDPYIKIDKWQHILATYDGTNINLYYNGSNVKTSAANGGIATPSKTVIGTSAGHTTAKYSGSICDIQIWSGTALSDSQVTQVYNGIDLSPTAHWKFDEKEGTTLGDDIGDLDGTIVNGNWEDRDIKCWNTRFDETDYNVTIETFVDPCDRNFLFSNVTPGAIREMYNILGTPKYIDTTYSSGNSLIFSPINVGLSGLRQERTIGVKNISDTFLTRDVFSVKIEGVRLNVE